MCQRKRDVCIFNLIKSHRACILRITFICKEKTMTDVSTKISRHLWALDWYLLWVLIYKSIFKCVYHNVVFVIPRFFLSPAKFAHVHHLERRPCTLAFMRLRLVRILYLCFTYIQKYITCKCNYFCAWFIRKQSFRSWYLKCLCVNATHIPCKNHMNS